MPASPRAAAVGLGSAALVLLGIPLTAGVIATYQMSIRHQRLEVEEAFAETLEKIRFFGVAEDRFPSANDNLFWREVPVDLAGVTGEYTVYGDGFAVHRLPHVVVAVLQQRLTNGLIEIPLDAFEADNTLGDLLGKSEGVGIAVGMTNGRVLILKDSMPTKALRPFLARNTAVISDIKDLEFYKIR